MKKLMLILCGCLPVLSVMAQPAPLLQDRENLLTISEGRSIDSLLQQYRQRSGNLVAVYTDTVDVSLQEVGLSVQMQYGDPKTDKHYTFILLMSRRHGVLFASVNQSTIPYVNEALLTGILQKGTSALKDQRRADGIREICQAAMEFMGRLPVKKE